MSAEEEYKDGLPFEKVIGIVTNFPIWGHATNNIVQGSYEEFKPADSNEKVFVATLRRDSAKIMAPSRTVLAFLISLD